MSKHPEITLDGRYRGVIYEYANIKTDMSYIGKTDNEKVRRHSWNNTSNKAYGGKKLSDARATHGIGTEVWKYEVLEEIFSDTQEGLNAKLKERETYWIREKDSVVNGYNGAYGDGNLGVKFSKARAAKCGDSMRGKHHSEKTKALISAKGKGRRHTEESRALISQKLRGQKRTEAQKKAQSERQKGIVPVAATAGAKEWVKRNGGGYWKNHPIPDAARANMKKTQQLRGTDCTATFPDGHTESFPTMLDAAKATGLNVGSVKYSIEHNSITRNGFKFRKP